MRPQSIIRFEQFYLGGTAITIVVQVLNMLRLFGPIRTEELAFATLLIILAIGYGLAFLFWYLIARRASNIAKWVLVILTVLGLFGNVPLMIAQPQTEFAYTAVMALILVLQLIAMVYLFRRDAVEWLRSRGQHGVVDVSAFN